MAERRDDRLRLRMLELLSDPKFLHHIAVRPPDGDRLLNRLAALVDFEGVGRLTARQRRVFECILRGMTQKEIGRACGIHQTSVHKTLHGNLVYSGPYDGRRHGGLLWKLADQVVHNPEARDIIERIAERDTDEPTSVRRGGSPWTRRWLRLVDPRRIPRRR